MAKIYYNPDEDELIPIDKKKKTRKVPGDDSDYECDCCCDDADFWDAVGFGIGLYYTLKK